LSFRDSVKSTLPAFRYRNFRLFWVGQLVSTIGTWMQTVALSWLVYTIKDSAFALGLLTTMNSLPILFLSLPAGIVADRVNKRKMIVATQAAFTVQAILLTVLVYTKHYNELTLIVLAALAGAIQAFDSPARQSFVSEMVPKDSVLSAVALNSAVFNVARTIGPMIGGLLIKAVGEAQCFAINAISFIAVIAALFMIREKDLFKLASPAGNGSKALSDLKEGFVYVIKDRRMLGVLCILSVASIFGLPALMLLPVFAKKILHMGPDGLGFLFAGAGVGSVVAAVMLALARKSRKQGLRIIFCFGLFSVVICVFSFAKSFIVAFILLAGAGFGAIAGIAMSNSTLQLLAPERLRGRIMGLYVFVFLGMMPAGNFLMGTAAHYLGAPYAVMAGGIACIAAIAAVTLLVPEIIKIDSPAEMSAPPSA